MDSLGFLAGEAAFVGPDVGPEVALELAFLPKGEFALGDLVDFGGAPAPAPGQLLGFEILAGAARPRLDVVNIGACRRRVNRGRAGLLGQPGLDEGRHARSHRFGQTLGQRLQNRTGALARAS